MSDNTDSVNPTDDADFSEEDRKLKKEKTYDLALTTMITMLPELIIPFINDIFGENFSDQATLTHLNTKHVVRQINGAMSRREADVLIRITENLLLKYYHIELETWFDGKLIIRIAEYGSNFAFEHVLETENGVVLEYPNSVAIFLRPDDSIPKSMNITHRGPNGAEMTYDIPVVQIGDYTVETIFDKKLYILLPFYLFKFANKFKEIDRDEKRVEKIKRVLEDIDKRLTEDVEVGGIGAYQKKRILELMQRVSQSLTQDYKNIRKGVDDVMSVAILRTETDDIYEQGIEQGVEQGIEQGIEQGQQETTVSHIKNLMKSMSLTADKAMDLLAVPQDQRTMYAGLVQNS